MKEIKNENKFSQNSLRLILGFALLELLIHLYSNAFAHYGIFRDELYYIACSRHLAAGYVDQPPLSSFILFASIKLFGDSLFAIRLLPAIASALTIFITGLITRKLGGGYFAIMLSCLSVALAPQFIGSNLIYSMNSFDWLFWSLATYIVILIIITESQKLWIWLGLTLGFGLLNKIDLLWFGAGLFAGLLATQQRKHLKTRWPYIAGAVALILFSPYIIWNFTHNFATLEFIHNASSLKYASQNPITMISGIFLSLNPFSAPVWTAGIYYFFFYKEGKTFRAAGYIFLTTFLILVINWHTKGEYLAPAFPLLYAAGGIMFEKISSLKNFVWIKTALPALIIVTGLLMLPLALPVLPVKTFIGYAQVIGISPKSGEAHKLEGLPQYYADMFGWKNMAATVSKVYTSLSPEEQKRTIVFAQNYGEAGAVDYYRKDFPLPIVVSGHNNYWYWGQGDTSFTTVIVIGGKREDHLKSCDSVVVADIIKSKYAMPYENNLPVFICRKFKLPFSEIWKRVRFFI